MIIPLTLGHKITKLVVLAIQDLHVRLQGCDGPEKVMDGEEGK